MGQEDLMKKSAIFLENGKVEDAWQLLHLGKII